MINATLQRDKILERKFTLYIKEPDRVEIEKLRVALTPEIQASANPEKYLDTKGALSVASMFRYLRQKEMERRGIK